MEIRALEGRSFSMESLYQLLGQSRQNIAQGQKRKAKREEVKSEVKRTVESHRKKHEEEGSRVMFHYLEIKGTIGLGVNKFEKIVNELGLTIVRKRSWIKTSDRCSRSKKYNNLINGKVLNGPNQLIVCDLTYIIGIKRYYVFAIKDVYTGRLVGLSGGIRMTTKVAIRALKQVFRLRGKGPFPELIHHTDGGSQYFSDAYLALLNKAQINISVAKTCLENGYAEQVNHIIKNNYLRFQDMSTEAAFQRSVKRTQLLYNSEKVQKGLGYRTPEAFEKYILSLGKDQRPEMKLFDFTKPKK